MSTCICVYTWTLTSFMTSPGWCVPSAPCRCVWWWVTLATLPLYTYPSTRLPPSRTLQSPPICTQRGKPLGLVSPCQAEGSIPHILFLIPQSQFQPCGHIHYHQPYTLWTFDSKHGSPVHFPFHISWQELPWPPHHILYLYLSTSV